MNRADVFLAWVSESELNSIASGRLAGDLAPWPSMARRSGADERVGVLMRVPDGDADRVQPLALIVSESQQRRLFTRFATLRDDLAPLSAWSHVLTTGLFDLVDALDRVPSLGGLESCWSGLAIAETLLIARRPLHAVRSPACFATLSYAIGRAQALWPRVRRDEVIERFDMANSLIRTSGVQSALIKEFQPIWSALADAPLSYGSGRNPIGAAIIGLRDQRLNDDSNPSLIVGRALEVWPESALLAELAGMHPESRVQAFDHVIDELKRSPKPGERREVLSFVAGFVASVAAGGAPSLGLAEAVAGDFPAVLAWAYVLIGARQRTAWSSAFGGLGRLINRELTRPFHLDEPPQCDFAVDEAISVIDRQLTDPLVHLKIKQRSISVALLPGVNLTLPLSDAVVGVTPNRQPARAESRGDMGRLADDLWPYILEKIKKEEGAQSAASRVSSNKKRGTAQGKFPLD